MSRRILELDGLRGVAACAVVVYHYANQYDALYGYEGCAPYSFKPGGYGPHLFFIISGFVILMTLERTKRAVDFATSRFFRLFPPYWVAVLTTFAVVRYFELPGVQRSYEELAWNMTMLQGFLGVKPVDGVYWTLKIELSFYVLALGTHLVGLMKRLPWLLYGWLLYSAVYYVLDGVMGWSHPVLSASWHFGIPEFAAFFIIGVALRCMHVDKGSARWAWPLIALANLRVVLCDEPLAAGVAIGGTAVLGLAVYGRMSWFAARPLVFLGAISYPLYLLHQNIGFVIIRETEAWFASPWPRMAIAAVVSLLLSTALTYGVERPALALRRKLSGRRRAPEAT